MRPTLIRILIVFLSGGLLLILAPALVDNLRLVGYLSQGSASFTSNISEPAFSCNESWLKTMALYKTGGLPEEAAWQAVLTCGPDYLPLLQAVQPANRKLAEQAATLYPNNAKVWFWLGEINNPKDGASALEDYQKAVSLDPSYALAWCRVGSALESANRTQEAADAFLNCCRLGDPGSNGCYGAGRMEEKLGNPEKAIEYYRLSLWGGALQRADELEKQLKP